MGGSFSSVGGRVRPHFAVFRVQGAPIITSNLDEGGALREGDTIQLAVTVDGVTPITYEWFKDGVSIPGATGDSLALGPLSEGDNGVYHVRVSNGNGYLLSRQFTVLVQAPPSVSNTALNLTEEIGETVQLTVSALGGGELQYEWYKNNALIPGETGTTLILSNLQPLDSGEYGVKVFNDVGTVRALIAILDVQFESVVQLRDDFLPFIPLQNVPSGIARGSNEGAGLETNEPVHGNKRSAGSIWLTWKAPSTGLVTFDTEGSNFDTLLAVYTGNTLAELIEIKAADDKRNDDVVNGRGRVKYSSEISFNAEAGSDYHIAVVGFSGERGDVVINWMFEEEENLPDFDEKGNRKITIARGFTQRLNGRANVFGGVYAWYHNGRLLADETGPELELVNIGDTEVGIYTVEVQRGGGGKKARKDFCVEIGASLGVNTENKLQDLDLPTGVLNRFGIEKRNIAIVTVGTLGTQVTDIYGSSVQGGEIAGAQNGSSRWFRLQPDDPGLMRVNTAGSTFENTLTIYTLKDESKDLAFTNLDFLT